MSRPSALRSLVLYPTNALVEDRTRLRRAIRRRRPPATTALVRAVHRCGLGGGDLPSGASSRDRVRDVAAQMRAAVSEFDELRSVDGLDLSQFPDPRQGEMIARWDMIASPPDVMVTNYSMLNVMLMRDIEEPLFTATRDWLASEPTNVFTLVVDEPTSIAGPREPSGVMCVICSTGSAWRRTPRSSGVATSASLTDDRRPMLNVFESSVHRSCHSRLPTTH